MSPKTIARAAGVVYLITIVAGIIGQGLIADRLVNVNDAALTAANIAAHGNLFRFAYTLFMIEQVAQVALSILFYELLKPVNRTVSLIAAVIGVTGSGIKALSRVFYVAPFRVLGQHYLSSFNGDQLNSLSLLFIRINNDGARVALVFFGFSVLLQGLLILRSAFLPRALGWLALIAGIGWLSNLWPPLGSRLFTPIALFALLGSFATIGWLLIYGVNEERWNAQAARQT